MNAPAHPLSNPQRAGSSAAAEAARLRERAGNLARMADQYDQGAHGERLTAGWLAHLPAGFVALHDLHVPGSKANVDHLVIGPTGVFVIDSKAHVGTFTAGSGTLWRGRSPMRKETDTVAFIARRVGEHLDVPVHALLCFTHATLPTPVVDLGSTRAVIVPHLLAVVTTGPSVHNEAMVGWLVRLAGELGSPLSTAGTAGSTPTDVAESRAASGWPTAPTLPIQRPADAAATAGGRPPTRKPAGDAARSGRSHPPKRSRHSRSKKTKSSPVAAVLGLLVIAALVAGAQRISGSAAPDGFTSVRPMITWTCPTPGAGHVAIVTWPTLISSTPYHFTATAGPYTLLDTTGVPSAKPMPVAGIAPSTALTVTAGPVGAPDRVSRSTATSPAEPC